MLLLVAAIWGATVVADSAQFSSCVTELGDPQYIGTALTIQMCIGFLVDEDFDRAGPEDWADWRYAFMILAPGPLFGVISMLRLRQLTRGREDCAWKTVTRMNADWETDLFA